MSLSMFSFLGQGVQVPLWFLLFLVGAREALRYYRQGRSASLSD